MQKYKKIDTKRSKVKKEKKRKRKRDENKDKGNLPTWPS